MKVIVALFVIGSVLCSGATASQHAIVSISANPAVGDKDFLSGLKLARTMGARGQFVSNKWSELEPRAGEYRLADLDGGFSYLGDGWGDTILFGLQVLNTTARETPLDLKNKAFDDPEMIARCNALIDRVARLHVGHLRYLSIGNEVDVYFASHPKEWDAYARFFQAVRAHARAVLPHAQTGVTFTAAGALGDARSQAQRFVAMSDVAILTYYPLRENFLVREPGVAHHDLAAFVDFAGSKPLVLQEVGYPSSALLHSSDDAQAQFFTNVFAAWRRHAAQIPFLNIFLLHDVPDATCSEWERYYGVQGANFHAYLCTLGLRAADGRPKKAFGVVSDLIKAR